MTKKQLGIIAALMVLLVALSVTALVLAISGKGAAQPTEAADIQYVLYLGTNHKDTNQPVFDQQEAKSHAEQILLKHFGGFTIQEAQGGWIDGNTVYREYTLVIYLSDTDLDKVHAAADEMVEVFHQSSVLIQANETRTEFYEGKK